MMNLLYDLWQESPPIHSAGFAAALAVALLASYLCLARVRTKAWNILSMSLSFPRNFVFQGMGYKATVNWKEQRN